MFIFSLCCAAGAGEAEQLQKKRKKFRAKPVDKFAVL